MCAAFCRRFGSCVGEVVAQVLCTLGHPVSFHLFPAARAEDGLPDFAVKTQDLKEVVTGEGKVSCR